MTIIRPATCLRYRIEFSLKGASVLLLKEYGDILEGLRLTC